MASSSDRFLRNQPWRGAGHLRSLAAAATLWICMADAAAPQALLPNPSPEEYVNHNGGGAEVVPSGRLSFAGRPTACEAFPTVADPLLNDYAAAPYKGFIIINPRLMPRLAGPVRLWIFYHECAHLLGVRDEAKADCLSTKRGLREGWLDHQGLEEVCSFISDGKADATHKSGPERCAQIRRCFRQ